MWDLNFGTWISHRGFTLAFGHGHPLVLIRREKKCLSIPKERMVKKRKIKCSFVSQVCNYYKNMIRYHFPLSQIKIWCLKIRLIQLVSKT
jgi:hypothetical protein